LKRHGFSRGAEAVYFCHPEGALAREGCAFSAAMKASLLIVALASLFLLGACSIKVDDKDKEAKKVDIKTPLADIKVDTSAASTDNGIPVYPGATLRPAEGDNNHRANVNIGAFGFGVKVVAVEYQTPDSPDKVKAFYLDKLAKYGKVLECNGSDGDDNVDYGNNKDLDKPVTCKGNKGDGVELKTGTNGNQHLVAIKSDGSGSRFGTVLVQIHGKDNAL
jgi:hypothetical protein